MSSEAILLSIVVVAFREGELLERALASVRDQLEAGVELLIAKSASACERTNQACRSEEGRGARVLWLRENRGLSYARNAGVEKASGKWVCFLDGDDELPPGAVARILAGIRAHPEAGFLYGDYDIHNVETGERSRFDAQRYSRPDGSLDAARAVPVWMLSGHGPVRRQVFLAHRGLRQRFSFGYQDVDFYFRLLLKGVQGHFIGGPLYVWHRSADGMNARRLSQSDFHRACSWRAYECLAGEQGAYERCVSPYLVSVDTLDTSQIGWLLLDLWPDSVRRCRTYFAFARVAAKGLAWRLLGRRGSAESKGVP